MTHKADRTGNFCQWCGMILPALPVGVRPIEPCEDIAVIETQSGIRQSYRPGVHDTNPRCERTS